jgi:hypothetical protein
MKLSILGRKLHSSGNCFLNCKRGMFVIVQADRLSAVRGGTRDEDILLTYRPPPDPASGGR